MANMKSAGTSNGRAWGTALFVVCVFLFVGVEAARRLTRHYKGEAFLHSPGIMDSLIAVAAPIATVACVVSTYREIKSSNG